MRILFLESHLMWIYGLPNGFRDAGHEVLVSGSLTENNIGALIEEFCPQLIIMLGWTDEHTGVKRKWIKKYVHAAGIPFIYWATEDPIHTQIFSVPFIKQVQPDFVFTVTAELVEYYKTLGFSAAHMDFGYHSSIHRTEEKQKDYECHIAVVANAYPGVLKLYRNFYRLDSLQTLIVPLLKANYRVDFWGWRWEEAGDLLGCHIPKAYLHGYLPYTEAYKVYNSADIVIGLQNLTSQVTQRTYEILGSGGFLITSDTPAVRKLFEPGRHLITAKSPEHTIELVRYYLEHPEKRQEIRGHGKDAVSCHSYQRRAEYIIKVLQEQGILTNDEDY